MTPDQERHLHRVQEDTWRLIDKKYRKGAEEHDGDLLRMSPEEAIREAIQEHVDAIVYLHRALELLQNPRSVSTPSPPAR